MLNFNKTLPAIAVAVIGFISGAWLFASLLSEPETTAPVATTPSAEAEPVKKAAKPETEPARLANDQG